jgi:hypothetical protein
VNANDTMVVQGGDLGSDGPVLVRYLAAALGQRRSYLFAPSLATRFHNVFLPLGRLVPLPTTGAPAGPVGHQLLVAPFVTLVGSAAHRAFRRTVTLTLLLLPIEERSPAPGSGTGSLGTPALRALEDRETSEIAAQWDWSPARLRRSTARYQLTGQLKDYLATSPHGSVDSRPSFTLRSLAESLLVNAAASVSLGRHPSASRGPWRRGEVEACREELTQEAFQSLHITKTSTILTWCGPDDNQGPSDQAEKAGKSLANLLFSTVRSPLREAMLDRFALPEAPIPEGPFVGAYYIAPHASLVYSYVIAGEESQRRGPIWMTAYLAYLGLALSSIRAALLALHREVDRITDVPGQLLHTAETLAELEEVFDLQFAVKTHRNYYEEIRQRDGALEDYSWLVKKVELLRDEAMLRRQHKENGRVLMVSVMVGVLTTVLAIPAALDLLVKSSDQAARHDWGIVLVVIAASAIALGSALSIIPAGVRLTRRWVVTKWVRRRYRGHRT